MKFIKKYILHIIIFFLVGTHLYSYYWYNKPYRVNVNADSRGVNLDTPRPLFLAKLAQQKANRILADNMVLTEETIDSMFKNNYSSFFNSDFEYSSYYKLLKANSEYYEIMFFSPKTKNDLVREYFLCTPTNLYKLDVRSIENEQDIIHVTANE